MTMWVELIWNEESKALRFIQRFEFDLNIQENDVTLWQWLDDGQNNEKPQEPQLLASFDHSFGDVNEIQFLEHESGNQLYNNILMW